MSTQNKITEMIHISFPTSILSIFMYHLILARTNHFKSVTWDSDFILIGSYSWSISRYLHAFLRNQMGLPQASTSFQDDHESIQRDQSAAQ